MTVLFSDEIFAQIVSEIKKAKTEICVISAFCKESILETFEKNISSSIKNKRLMVRFRLADLVSGATDVSIYPYCKSHGWSFYIDLDMHAKTYIFDRKRCILGSANATNKGLGLSEHFNMELSKFFDLENTDYPKINALFDKALLCTDDLYERMKNDLDNVSRQKGEKLGWSDDVMEFFDDKITSLFSYELPQSNKIENDFSFLDIEEKVITKTKLKNIFRKSKAFRWLKNVLKAQEKQEIYFGQLTALLHNNLVEDPKPYRKDVKLLLQNLLAWTDVLAKDVIEIDQPNHSQRIRLK